MADDVLPAVPENWRDTPPLLDGAVERRCRLVMDVLGEFIDAKRGTDDAGIGVQALSDAWRLIREYREVSHG